MDFWCFCLCGLAWSENQTPELLLPEYRLWRQPEQRL